MARHIGNKNLTLHFGNAYRDLPILEHQGAFIREYLACLYNTLYRTLADCPSVFAVGVDLRLPLGVPLPDYAQTDEVIELFFESLNAKVKHNRRKAKQKNKHAHDARVRYVWARERSGWHGYHHHGAILVNNDAFTMLGCFASDGVNMFKRLEEAWASALGLPVEAVRGLVSIPDKACYWIRRDDLQSQAEFFQQASYLCKAATKIYGDGAHAFGASRD